MIALIHIYCSTSLCAVYIKVSQSQCTGAYIQGFQPMSIKLGGRGLRQHRHETDRVTSHSEPLWWEKIGKVANWVKLAIPSHSELLQWEKIGKVANRVKLAIPSHSEPLWWGKIGKVVNQAKLAIPSHSELLRWEKIGKVALCAVRFTDSGWLSTAATSGQLC